MLVQAYCSSLMTNVYRNIEDCQGDMSPCKTLVSNSVIQQTKKNKNKGLGQCIIKLLC